jgi:hypothetical protein
MHEKGYPNFGMYQHTQLWKSKDIDFKEQGYGTQVAKAWYWYEKWVKEVEEHCKMKGELYK